MQQLVTNILVLNQYIEIAIHIKQMRKPSGEYMKRAVVQALQEMKDKQHIVYIEE